MSCIYDALKLFVLCSIYLFVIWAAGMTEDIKPLGSPMNGNLVGLLEMKCTGRNKNQYRVAGGSS